MSRVFHTLPRAALVEPEQLGYDAAYAIALTPALVLGLLYFRQDAALLLALSVLAGVVCLLALQLARLTGVLPAWVGHRASHPLVASLLVAVFLPPQTLTWVAAGLVVVLVILDTLVWPPLKRIMVHPALVVFALLLVARDHLGGGFLNPFDGRHLDDPLTLWFKLGLVIDPIKLYVGNVPGPIAATSAGALLLGVAYLWYGRKVSLTLLAGFLAGVGLAAAALREDVAFQVASGPALFLVGFLAADRRRLVTGDRIAAVAGIAAGALAVPLRAHGQADAATWEALLAVGLALTVGVRFKAILATRSQKQARGAATRARPVRSGTTAAPQIVPSRPTPAPVPLAREPALATATVRRADRAATAAPRTGYGRAEPDDIVRQMRRSAAYRPARPVPKDTNPVLWALALLLVNPLGLWMTWTNRSFSFVVKALVTLLSTLWYLAAAGAFFAATHGLIKA